MPRRPPPLPPPKPREGLDKLAILAPNGEPTYLSAMFAQQRAFINDPARFKAALCGRRGGKTESVVAWLIDGAHKKPGTVQAYIALSQRNARRILWTTLHRVCKRHGVQATFNEQTLECRFPNGSKIWVTGCDNKAQAEDFRGLPYFRVAIDEAGSFASWLEYLVDDVLTPALLDHTGELALVGSPGLVPLGYFYDRTDGDRQWSTHRWTCLDNPFVPGSAELERLKRENNWDDNHPTYVREWLGRWVRDDAAIVYPFDPLKNIGDMPLAEERVYRVLSIDLGFKPDPCAFVIGASRPGDPTWYGERAWRREMLTPMRLSAEVSQVLHEAKIDGKPIDRVVVDEGGLGKSIGEGMRADGIPCFPAEKTNKVASIHTFRGGLIAGTVKVAPIKCQQLREEWMVCAWNDTRDDHDERCLDDLCDSALYNYREHRLTYQPEPNPPKAGTREWHAQYKAERLKALRAEQKARRRTA